MSAKSLFAMQKMVKLNLKNRRRFDKIIKQWQQHSNLIEKMKPYKWRSQVKFTIVCSLLISSENRWIYSNRLLNSPYFILFYQSIKCSKFKILFHIQRLRKKALNQIRKNVQKIFASNTQNSRKPFKWQNIGEFTIANECSKTVWCRC